MPAAVIVSLFIGTLQSETVDAFGSDDRCILHSVLLWAQMDAHPTDHLVRTMGTYMHVLSRSVLL